MRVAYVGDFWGHFEKANFMKELLFIIFGQRLETFVLPLNSNIWSHCSQPLGYDSFPVITKPGLLPKKHLFWVNHFVSVSKVFVFAIASCFLCAEALALGKSKSKKQAN